MERIVPGGGVLLSGPHRGYILKAMKDLIYLGNVWEYPSALKRLPGARLTALLYEDEGDSEAALRVSSVHGARSFRVRTDEEVREALNGLPRADLAVMANFGILLTAATLALPRSGFVNFHPGRLPEQAGRAPISTLWASGGGPSALTVHRVTPEVDAGPVLQTFPYAVDARISLDQNLYHIYRLGIAFFPQLISL